MNCLECETYESCDYIRRVLELIPENCIDNHFNAIIREHTQNYVNKLKEREGVKNEWGLEVHREV